jgi:hypothetical protein
MFISIDDTVGTITMLNLSHIVQVKPLKDGDQTEIILSNGTSVTSPRPFLQVTNAIWKQAIRKEAEPE